MPNYNLVIKYVDDVKKNVLLGKMFNEQILDQTSLMNIDYFTSHYDNKYKLMEDLEFYNIIEPRDVRKRIKIEYRNSGITKEAQILYKDDLKFLNIDFLTKYIIIKYNDVKFLEFLIDTYKDNPIQKKNIEVFSIYVNKYNHGFYSQYNFDDKQDLTNNINALLDFICRQIYKYDNDKKAYVYNEDGTPMVNYKPYRDFAKVISNYSKKYDTQEQIQQFEDTHFENKDINSSLKTLIKRK